MLKGHEHCSVFNKGIVASLGGGVMYGKPPSKSHELKLQEKDQEMCGGHIGIVFE